MTELTHPALRLPLAGVYLVAFAALGCGGGDSAYVPEEIGRCADFDANRNPYFGDTHIHTALSLDASLQGTRLGPRDAYRFARGETVGIQPHDAQGNALRTITIDRPLDFAAVSDHAEFLGTVGACTTPGSVSFDHPQCVLYRDEPDSAFFSLNFLLAADQRRAAPPALCGVEGVDCLEPARDAWHEIRAAAEEAYDRTEDCVFTSFVGYEWSGAPSFSVRNLHRNVIFRNEVVPELPTGYFEESRPEGLWAALRRDCLDRRRSGCDVLTIPHNSNLSGGRMFEPFDLNGDPFSVEYATERRAMEPLVEVFQHKGDSECEPGTTLGDEQCDFEKLPFAGLAAANLDRVSDSPQARDFMRHTLGEGLRYQRDLGVNPFEYGMIASTDTHIAAPGYVDEMGFAGHGGAGQSNSGSLPEGLTDRVYFNPGGLIVAWAEENSREAIFTAMRRKEVYGTSGPRIVLRFFGGFGYEPSVCGADDFAAQGYAGGVPMGGVLSPPPSGGAPTFAISALRDPGTSEMEGTPLQRVQVVKGWLAGDELAVQVFDVAGDGDNGASVDAATCETSGDGFDSLCTVWTDPDFDPGQLAFYYVRVLENPTCRWSGRQCNEAPPLDCEELTSVPPEWRGCCDDRFPRTQQERAWSSPIWVRPS